MGVPVSTRSDVDESRRRHLAAERLLLADRLQSHLIFKLLLLGPGESGKSTIVKQMRILHAQGFTAEEIKQQQSVIAGNVLHSISNIIRAMEKLRIQFHNSDLINYAPFILKAEQAWQPGGKLAFEEWESIKAIWNDKGTQKCFQRAHEYQLDDSTKYFCDDIGRISSLTFVPTEQDILRSRVSTLGIVEISFPMNDMTIRVIDVGGQRSQRKKWIHCFEGVNGLIFIAAISEYNQMLFEDNQVNRMHESLRLFETICNCQWFVKTPIVLFLNKKDIFEEKLKTFPITIAFPDYKGESNFEDASDYIQLQFHHQKKDEKKIIYVHKTCATDTKNVQFVMDSSFDMILTQNMKKSGLY